VDDEPLIRWLLSEVLAESGHAVTEAAAFAKATADNLPMACQP
jgi:CheY-like chemotaxis protein